MMKKGEWHRVGGKLVRRKGRKPSTATPTPKAATIRSGPPSIDQLADAVLARVLDRVAEKLAEQ
jgi:hypothetical protein